MKWGQESKNCAALYPPLGKVHWLLTCAGFHRPGCSMPEIWDVEDPENAGKPPLCNLLVKDPTPHFTTVFQNSVYKVLEVIEEWPPPTEERTSDGVNALLIAHASFLIQIPKTFTGNCFQIENVLVGQFVILIIRHMPFSVGYSFSAPLKICYANEYMLVFDFNICAKMSGVSCVQNTVGCYEDTVSSELRGGWFYSS